MGYFEEISKFRVPSAAEERELFRRYREHVDHASRLSHGVTRRAVERQASDVAGRIAEGYLRYVVRVAHQFLLYKNQELLKDLINAGNMGMLEAIRRFDPARNKRFLTYADYWIRVRIQEQMAQLDVVRPSGQVRKNLRKARREAERLQLLGHDVPNVVDRVATTPIDDLPLPAPPPTTPPRPLLPLLRAAALTPRQQYILVLRYGLDGAPHTVADVVHVLRALDGTVVDSRTVRREETEALAALRAHCADQGLDVTDLL